MRGTGADQLGPVIAAVVQPHLRLRRAAHHVVVRDDVPVVVPDEARARAARDAEHVARPQVAYELGGGDEDYRAFRALEELDGALLIGGEVPARGDDARLGNGYSSISLFQPREPLPDEHAPHRCCGEKPEGSHSGGFTGSTSPSSVSTRSWG